MKKSIIVLSLLCLICAALSGCSKGEAQAQGLTVAETEQTKDVDIDLTELSSTLVYAEVYNMMMSPDEYMGQTVKMSGSYYASFAEETDQYYHYVIIEDAAACCQSGLEFMWSGDHEYPADYPADNTNVEVTGVFSSYDELGQTYYYLAVDDINEI
jgi:hypothetical protein